MAEGAFDSLMASLDAPMVVVTTAVAGEQAGCLVGFHAQSAIDPQRYCVWLSKANHTYRLALRSTYLAVHFLTEDDLDLAEHFGTETGEEVDKFEGVVTRAGADGVPLLERLPHRMLVKRVALLDEGGDHVCLSTECLDAETDKLDESELPRSVFELTEPQWRGRVGVAPTNGSFQAFVTGMRVLHGDERTRQWLEDLAANDPQIRDSNAPIVADVDEGRIDVGLVNHYYLYERAKELGVPVDQLAARNYYFPDGDIGSMVNVSGVGVLRHSADDPDVRAFLDFLLSEDAQLYFAEETSEYPMIEVPGPAGLPSLSSLPAPEIDLNDLDSLQESVAMIAELGLA